MSKLNVRRYNDRSERRKTRIRGKLARQPEFPRLSVHRSNRYLFAQVINQGDGKSLAGVRGEKPEEVGKTIAEKAIKLGVKSVVFDRGQYAYHGKVRKLAEAAREAGLKF